MRGGNGVLVLTGAKNGTIVQCQASRGGKMISAQATLFVIQMKRPSVFITSPANNVSFSAPEMLTLLGFSDPSSCFLQWQVWLHHDEHRHPWRASLAVANATRLINVPGKETEPSRSVFLKVILLATDPVSKLTGSAFVRVSPAPLSIPANIFAPWARFKRGPSWTDGLFRIMNGSGAFVGDEFNLTKDATVAIGIDRGAVGTFDVIVGGSVKGTLNSTHPIFVNMSMGVISLGVGSNVPARVGNLTVELVAV